MDLLNRIESTIVQIEKIIIVIFSIIMIVSVFLQVFFRYVVKMSVPWTEETSIISFVIISFYGAIYASYHHRHLGINQLVNKLSETSYKVVWIIKNIILSFFLINVLFIIFLPTLFESLNQSYTVTRLPFFYIFINIPILGILICFHLVMSFLRKDYHKEFSLIKMKES